MGSRPSSFKEPKRGGFLKGVDGVISDYKFTDCAFGLAEEDPKNPGYIPLHMTVFAKVDGADEPVSTNLNMGNALNYEISDDGHTITSVEKGGGPTSNFAGVKFVASLCATEFDEEQLSDEEDVTDWTPIIGSRVRFDQTVDETKVNKDGTPKMRKDKKDPKKEYPYTRLVVTEYYGKEEVPKKGAAAKGKPAKAAPAAKGKKPAADDVSEPATEALLRYLGDAPDNTLVKTKIRMKVLTDKTFANQNDLKNNVMSWLANDANLTGIEGVSVAGDKVSIG